MSYERDADELALASKLQEDMNSQGVAASRRALEPQTPKDKEGNHVKVTECVEPDCGETLPPIRIEMGRIRCTPCQVLKDKADKLRGR